MGPGGRAHAHPPPVCLRIVAVFQQPTTHYSISTADNPCTVFQQPTTHVQCFNSLQPMYSISTADNPCTVFQQPTTHVQYFNSLQLIYTHDSLKSTVSLLCRPGACTMQCTIGPVLVKPHPSNSSSLQGHPTQIVYQTARKGNRAQSSSNVLVCIQMRIFLV